MLFARHKYIRLLLLIVVIALPVLSVATASAGDPFGFSSSWNYRENGGDAGSSRQFNEIYNLTYSKEISAAMVFSGAVRYSDRYISDGDDSSTLNPNLSLDVRNDLFSLNLNAAQTQSKRDSSARRTSDFWGLNLNSQIDNWPSLRFYFNQGTSSDNNKPKQTDSDSMTTGGSIEYSYDPISLLYDVRYSETSDNIERVDTDTLDQTAMISYDQSFYQGRVSVSASQQFQRTENTTERRVGSGNIFYEEVPPLPELAPGFYGIDNTPSSGFLPLSPDLTDGDRTSPTGIDLFVTTDLQNMAVYVNFQPVTRLEVFLADELTPTQQSLLAWQVFRSDDGDNWTLLGSAVSYPTEADANGVDRTVVTVDLPFPVSAEHVKVVSSAAPAVTTPVFVAELQASVEKTATDDVVSTNRVAKNLQTHFSSTVRMTDQWSVSYSLRRSENMLDSGDTVQLNQSLSSIYTLSEKVGFSAGVSDNDYDADNAPDRHNRSYSMSMTTQPLPTLNFSLGYTYSESDTDDGRDTNSHSISSTLNAIIFPDLTASLSTFWTQNEDKADGTENRAYGFTLNTTAYLSPRLDLNTTLNYSESDSDDGDDSSTRYSLQLGYRPSDILLLNASFSGDVDEGTSSLRGTSSWIWTDKLQTQIGSSYDFGDGTRQQYNALLSWSISHSLSLLSSGNYLLADEGDSWDFNLSLNMVF